MNAQHIATTLEAAVQKLRAGRPDEAHELLHAALATAPKDPDLLHLAGVAARQLGRPAEAITLMRQSLSIRPKQPHVLLNLGNALRAAHELDPAQKAYEEALAVQPALADAALGLGLVLHTKGESTTAVTMLRRAVQLAPASAAAQEALGIALTQAGHAEDALISLEEARRLAPNNASVPHNAGIALEALKRDRDALVSYQAAVALAPQQAMSWFAIGNLQRRLGEFEASIAAYRRAIEIAPGMLDAHAAINETIWQAGAEGYLGSFPYAISRMPEDASVRRAYADQLNRVRLFQEAEAQARAALALAPDEAGALDALGSALLGQARVAEAIAAYRHAAAAAASDIRLRGRYVEALVRGGELGPAHDELTRLLVAAPHDQENLARMTILQRLLGEAAAYRRLADYASLTSALEVAPPEGYRDVAAFHADLAPYLLSKHQAKQHPTDQTLRGGTQTLGALFADPHPLIQGLRASLLSALQRFVEGLPEDRAHPFLGRKSSRLKFAGSWSVRLACDGFHTNHIHPAGWISSAYYIHLPQSVNAPESRQGWFKLGETNPDTSPALPVEKWVQPREGHLVLFPSYFWHGTEAFHDADERLTVAFDVIPDAG
ncbi:MAG: tetratricopeptide repeat protein [Hyphomonadaceae bacterium]|nr:tetratricopeptide repeat protein [Hyphomonadaceae bacterium]